MVQLQHFAEHASRDDMLAALKADGAIIIDDVMSAEDLAQIRAECDPYMEASANGDDDFTGRLTTRTGGLVSRSAKCRDLIADKTILGLCDGFLLENCERYQLHLTQIIRLRPTQTAQAINRDRWAWGTHLAHVEPQLNTIWAFSDFTAENGATNVVPGSTQCPDNRVPTPEEITQATMRAGSVLVYTGSVFHGGGENKSDGDRIGLNLTYALGWLRQEENQYLSTPPELAAKLNPAFQELIGYAMGQYALGYYTPPGAPGEHPELSPPQYALGRGDEVSGQLGSPEDLEVLAAQTSGKS